MLGRVELPQAEIPLLALEDPGMSMTWTTLTSLSFLLTRFWTHVWSLVNSPFLPHGRPFSYQEVSGVGILDRNSGAATHAGSRGPVI